MTWGQRWIAVLAWMPVVAFAAWEWFNGHWWIAPLVAISILASARTFAVEEPGQ